MSKSEQFYEAWLSHRHVSRRGLFRAFVTAAKEVAPAPDSLLPSHPLPPGALPVAAFVQQCNQCDACITACQMGVLSRHENGLVQLVIEFSSCDGCGECIRACTTGAIVAQPRFDTGLRPVFSKACVNPLRACNQCSESCPVAACSPGEDNIPEVDTSICNGCGECLIQCSQNAISMQSLCDTPKAVNMTVK